MQLAPVLLFSSITISMREKFLLPLLAVSALFSVTATTSAIKMEYQIGDGSIIDGNFADAGIKSSLVDGLENIAFALDDWQSWTFNFFDIWTEEGDVATDDTTATSITATLDFDASDGLSPDGHTVGVSGIFESGKIRWHRPVTVTAGGRTFILSLSDEEFNGGLFGLTEGATVEATIKQISSDFSVPDNGSTAMLLGLAFIALALVCQRKITV
jgi:hypothetical protein